MTLSRWSTRRRLAESLHKCGRRRRYCSFSIRLYRVPPLTVIKYELGRGFIYSRCVKPPLQHLANLLCSVELLFMACRQEHWFAHYQTQYLCQDQVWVLSAWFLLRHQLPIVAWVIICLVKATYRDLFASLCVLNDLGPTIFRMFFTFSTGPLAISIALFRNSLVFHSFDHMCILAVHIGPPLTLYGMRWYAEDLENHGPIHFISTVPVQAALQQPRTYYGHLSAHI